MSKPLSITTLGSLSIAMGGGKIGGLTSQKAIALLIYLVVEKGIKHRRESTFTLLWPGMPEKSARNNLRQVLFTLRQIIPEVGADDEDNPVPLLLTDRKMVQINPEAQVDLDIHRIDSLIQNTRDHNHDKISGCKTCRTGLETAATLFQGEFLQGFYLEDSNLFEEWAEAVRESYRKTNLNILETLGAIAIENHDYDRACEFINRQLAIDNLQETAHRRMMEALFLSGRRVEALRHYQDCVRILNDQLGISPSTETIELYDRIRTEDIFQEAIPPKVDKPADPSRPVPVSEPEEEIDLLGGSVRFGDVLEEGNIKLGGSGFLDAETIASEDLSTLGRIELGLLVGRDREVKGARELWEKSRIGEGQLLLISGEAGIGKSRLVREIISWAVISGGQAYIGENQPEGNASYAAFAQITRRSIHAYQKGVLEIPALVMADLITISPELQVDFPDTDPNPLLSPEAEQRRLFESFIVYLARLSEVKPLLLVVEDIHWGDSGTLALLQMTAKRCREKAVMLVGTYREVEVDQALKLEEIILDLNRRNLGTHIKLDRLNQTRTRTLLEGIFKDEITPEFLDEIYQVTDGNPFFIEEICKALVESDEVWFDDGTWHRPQDMTDMVVPRSIKVAIQTHLKKLDKTTQTIFLHASVIGHQFEYKILQGIVDADEDILIDGLESGISIQLIEEIEAERFRFMHALIPASLRESISSIRLAKIHRSVAQAYEENSPDAYQRLAYHWGAGGVEEKELDYTIKAANQARQTYANEDAIHHYTRALELKSEVCLERFDLLTARSRIYGLVGDREEQRIDAEAMLELAESLQDDFLRCKALLSLAEHFYHAELGQALEYTNQALVAARSLDDPILEARGFLLLGDIKKSTYQYHQGLELLEKALALFEDAGLISEATRCTNTISLTYGLLADYQNEKKAAEKALSLSRSVGDRQLESIALYRLGCSLYGMGEYESGQSFCNNSIDISQQIGDKESEMAAFNNLGLIQADQREFEKASQSFLRSIQIASEISSTTVAVNNNFNIFVSKGEYEAGLRFMQIELEKTVQDGNDALSVAFLEQVERILYDLGQYGRVIELQDEYLQVKQKIDGPLQKEACLSLKGLCLYLRGDKELGWQMMEAALGQLKDAGSIAHLVDALVRMAFAKTVEENPADLRMGLEFTKRARPLCFDSPLWWHERELLLSTTARLNTKLGLDEAALEASTEVVEEFEDPYVRRWREIDHFAHASALRAAGRDADADHFLKKAYDRVMLVARKTQDEFLRQSWLENVPHNREILVEAKARGFDISA